MLKRAFFSHFHQVLFFLCLESKSVSSFKDILGERGYTNKANGGANRGKGGNCLHLSNLQRAGTSSGPKFTSVQTTGDPGTEVRMLRLALVSSFTNSHGRSVG